MAITRNASEALEIVQLGIDLKPGDEVLTTDQDYPRMITTWQQRERRDGIVLKTISFPMPPPSMDDLYQRFERAITPAHERDSLLPHHQPDRPDLPGEEDLPDGASAASRPSWTARTPSRSSRSRTPTSTATTTAPACTSGCSRRTAPASSTCASEDRRAVAADGRAGVDERQHPQVRGDRHASGGQPQRDRRGADVP